MASSLMSRLTRTRRLEGDVMETELRRCLTTTDLVLIGIGSMVGSGMYVLAGEIANEVTGPAVVLSFLVAGIASGLSAWCYGEFGARVPKAGSAYVYTYLTIGEFAAFIIGWNMVLEHVIGAAAVVRGLVGYIDELANEKIYEFTAEIFSSERYDPIAPIVIIFLGILVCLGVKESVRVNNVLSVVNIAIATLVIIVGFTLAKSKNWDDFLPYGVSSIFEGAAQAYFAFVGYDSIAIASEEALDPSFSIPFALAFDVFFVGILYCFITSALTLMVNYKDIDENSAFSSAFDDRNVLWAKYIVSVGAIAAMTCALLGMVFTMPRCIYAMASDGLLFKFLSKVHPTTKVPVYSTIIGVSGICVFAFFLTIQELAEFMSIGTLLAYIIIAIAVIVLRYSPYDPITGNEMPSNEKKPLVGQPTPWGASQLTSISIFLVSVVILNVFLNFGLSLPPAFLGCMIGLFASLCIGSLVWLKVVSTDNGASVTCRVPLVPFLPGLSVFVNLYLMCHLTYFTWIRFVLWMAVGLVIYFLYGINNSVLEEKHSPTELTSSPEATEESTKDD